MDITNWTRILRLKPRNAIPVVLFMGFILIAPVKWLNTLGIATLVHNYRQWIAIALLASCALLISPVILWVVRNINNKISNLEFRRNGKRYLKSLTPDEKDILNFYIFEQKRTQILDFTDGTVMGLVHARIIYQASRLTRGMTLPFNIQQRAWDFLNNNNHLLRID